MVSLGSKDLLGELEYYIDVKELRFDWPAVPSLCVVVQVNQ
jgi:hypothetical protein